MPGGAAGLQNQSGGRKVPGGFDSLPSPPSIVFIPELRLTRTAFCPIKIYDLTESIALGE